MGAAGLAGAAALVALSAVTRDRVHPPSAATVVSVRPIAAGSMVNTDDVRVIEVPVRVRPERAFTASEIVVGKVVSSAVDAGEVLTPSRLVGADLLAAQPADRVAMTVPVLDAHATGARAGSHIDLYATGSGVRAASDVVVLSVSGGNGEAGSTWGQAAPTQLTLALTPTAAAQVTRQLSVLGAGEAFVVALRREGAR
ncbi:MAG: SAF domain-containing protein [Humibacillus sp.]|nr:SAF domain-containing protein [Humibacillus sp.]MDN5778285.1 SAF domain-containing protein [Humibacillus sp.]